MQARREAEKELFNGVIRFLIAPWEMCFGVAPGKLNVAPYWNKPDSLKALRFQDGFKPQSIQWLL